MEDPEFERNLNELHPWRAEETRTIVRVWPQVRHFLYEIASARDRAVTLSAWANGSRLDEAPPTFVAMLACLAADYGESTVAVSLVERAIADGLPDSNYWWGRAALWVDHEKNPEEVKSLLMRSVPAHPLASAQLFAYEGQYEEMAAALELWLPISEEECAIRASLLSVSLAGRGEFEQALAHLMDSVDQWPLSAGLLTRLAQLMLRRGFTGETHNAIDDYSRAAELALRARELRRRYHMDSVEPLLVAIEAALLCGDIEGAWGLTQSAPGGICTDAEARDRRVRRDAAVVAALRGDIDSALRLAGDLNDSLQLWVRGVEAHATGNDSVAQALWEAASPLAETPQEELRIAHSLALVGAPLPALEHLVEDYPAQVQNVRLLQRVMNSGEDRSDALRVAAPESKELTSLLARDYALASDHETAAVTLEKGAKHWQDPMMMLMAARERIAAGQPEVACDDAKQALALGGPNWPGRVTARRFLFDALLSAGSLEDAALLAREMLGEDPEDLDARWAYIHCLIGLSEQQQAWHVINYKGTVIAPRSKSEAGYWLELCIRFDRTTGVLTRVMQLFHEWSSDPEFQGAILSYVIHEMATDLPVAGEELADWHTLIENYADRNPESSTFQVFKTGDDGDPLGPVLAALQQRTLPDGARELVHEVELGRLPLGFLTEFSSHDYLELAIYGIAGCTYSQEPADNSRSLACASSSIDTHIVIDATALASISHFESGLAKRLLSEFGSIVIPHAQYRDAHSSARSLDRKATSFVGLDDEGDGILVDKISDALASRCAERGARALEDLQRVGKTSLTSRERIAKLEPSRPWTSAMEVAIARKLPLWCDDRALRALTFALGGSAFSTVDVLDALSQRKRWVEGVCQVAKATLIANGHVELRFESSLFRTACELSGWRAEGVSCSLRMPTAWVRPEGTFSIIAEALDKNASDPVEIQSWAYAASVGLLRIQPDDDDAAASNLEVFLSRMLTLQRGGTEGLPFCIAGVRRAMAERGQIRDPLEHALQDVYAELLKQHRPPLAAAMLQSFTSLLSSADKDLSARIVLTQGL